MLLHFISSVIYDCRVKSLVCYKVTRPIRLIGKNELIIFSLRLSINSNSGDTSQD
jgi:hypothetical protein